MRKIITIVCLCLLPAVSLTAQKPIYVYEDTLQLGNSQIPALTVVIPEVEYDNALKSWIKEQESGTRSKVVTENGNISIFGANMKDISPTPVNIYSNLSDKDTALLLSVAFELRKDEYIGKASAETDLANAKIYLFNFSKNQYIDFATEELKAEESKLRNIEREFSSLQNNESKISRSLAKNNRTVIREKEELINLNNELTSLNAAIEEHSIQLAGMLDGTARDEKEDYLKDLEKDKKKVQRSIRRSENRLKKAENAINKANRDLPRNDNNQERIREQIKKQASVVEQYTEKLNRIKAYK